MRLITGVSRGRRRRLTRRRLHCSRADKQRDSLPARHASSDRGEDQERNTTQPDQKNDNRGTDEYRRYPSDQHVAFRTLPNFRCRCA